MDTNTEPVATNDAVVAPVISTSEVVTAAPVAPKKGKGIFGIIVIFLVFIIIAVIGIGGVLAYTTVKGSYIPVLSPVLEDIVLAPHEQFAQRFDIYYDLSQKLLDEDGKQSSNINAVAAKELSENLSSIETMTEFNAKITLDKALSEGVLGVDESGEADEEKLMEMLAAKEFEISGQTKATANGLKDKMARTMSENVITIKAAGNTLETKFDLYTELSEETTNIDFYLHYFPKNPYLMTESIEKMWIKYPTIDNTQELDSWMTDSEMTEPTVADKDTELTNPLENLQKLLHHPVMAKIITAAPSEKVNGTSTKCYTMTINNENYAEFEAAVKEVYPELVTAESDMPEEDYELKATFCFDGMLIIRKIGITLKSTAEGTTLDFSGSLQLNSFNQNNAIKTPTDVTDFEEIDWTEVLPMLSYYNDMSVPGYDYEGSESDLLNNTDESDFEDSDWDYEYEWNSNEDLN